VLSEVFGWAGLRVDPNPEFAASHSALEEAGVSFRPVLVGMEDGGTARILLAGGLTTRAEYIHSDSHAAERISRARFSGTSEILVRRLDSLLAEVSAPRIIDYMSVDTEGSELEVLQTFPWSDFRIRTLTVEHNFDHARIRSYDELLSKQGMVRVLGRVSAWDSWYLDESLLS
jgi:hypothetical protein